MPSVWWKDNAVQLIDQRLLPTRLETATLHTVTDVAASIRDMYVRGAPAIGATAAYGMALAARLSSATDRKDLLDDLQEAKQVLDAARPTAVNLAWATGRILATLRAAPTADPEELRSLALAEAEALAEADVEINRRMGANGAGLIPEGANLLHHCNTGSLATVDYGTALGVIYACHEQGKGIHVWVDETRPRLQGARLTAWELMRAEIPMHLIADNASGSLMRQGRVDAVIFGADRVAANGDVANKIGTYNIALLAHTHGIPVYCIAPTSTVDLDTPTGDDIPIEERDAAEVTRVGRTMVAPEAVPVYNPAFDITPARYISAIVTEEGVCHAPYGLSLGAAVARAAET